MNEYGNFIKSQVLIAEHKCSTNWGDSINQLSKHHDDHFI